ncbi:MAG TPA: hypothetical protein VIJ28_06680, partial [Chloroflexota bacterium]
MSLLKRIEGASAGAPTESVAPVAIIPSQPPPPPRPQAGGLNSALTALNRQEQAPVTNGTISTLAPQVGGNSMRTPARQGLDSIAALRRAPANDQDNFAELRSRVQQKLIQDIGPNADFSQAGEMRKRIQT